MSGEKTLKCDNFLMVIEQYTRCFSSEKKMPKCEHQSNEGLGHYFLTVFFSSFGKLGFFYIISSYQRPHLWKSSALLFGKRF